MLLHRRLPMPPSGRHRKAQQGCHRHVKRCHTRRPAATTDHHADREGVVKMPLNVPLTKPPLLVKPRH